MTDDQYTNLMGAVTAVKKDCEDMKVEIVGKKDYPGLKTKVALHDQQLQQFKWFSRAGLTLAMGAFITAFFK
jgi:hypothetical protein